MISDWSDGITRMVKRRSGDCITTHLRAMSTNVDRGSSELQPDAPDRPTLETGSLDPTGGCSGHFALTAGTNGTGSILRRSTSVSLSTRSPEVTDEQRCTILTFLRATLSRRLAPNPQYPGSALLTRLSFADIGDSLHAHPYLGRSIRFSKRHDMPRNPNFRSHHFRLVPAPHLCPWFTQ
jgi:hypothetical protein